MKKIISVVLAIIMSFSVLVVPVSAQDTNGPAQNAVAIVETTYGVIADIISFMHGLIDNLFAMFGMDCPICGGTDDLIIPDANKGLTINKDVFEYDNETNVYSFIDVVDCLNGTLKNTPNVEKLTFTVNDLHNNVLDYGEIDVNENWSTTAVDFMLGENKLTVSASYKDGSIVSESLSVLCYSDAYMENLQIDTETDTDGDKLADYLEINYTNTDINKIDTDEDGLTDYEEVYLFDYNPLNKDSDQDGVLDSDEDYDVDNLSNINEINLGLDPTYSDSDLDGLNDSDEINVYSTDPLKKDTDEDEVSDGEEVRIGTNPLVKESKFTETQEYGEITENTPTSVQVSAVLNGEQVGTLDVNTVTYSDNKMISPTVPGYLDVAYDFSVDGQIDSAEIVFNYDTSLGEIGANFQPRIYYYNESAKMFEELPNQKVENGKVSAEVEHFSTYILLNKVEFDAVWNNEIKSPVVDDEGNIGTIDVAFVVDNSGSMSSSSRLSTAKTALRTFVNALDENDRAALIKFTSTATVLTDLTKDKNIVKNKISSLSANGLTSMYKGLSSAINLLTKDNEQYGYKMIIVLTDGYDEPSTSYSGYYESLVNKAKDNNIVIYTVGTGTIDKNLLTKIANETGGEYYLATATSGILDSFEYIKESTVDLTADKNGDKIPDYYNDLIFSGEMVLSNGSDEFMGINFNYGADQNPDVLCADMDGDGLLNGEELVIRERGDTVYIEMISDPCMENSDSDEHDDYFEVNDYSDPLSPSYESDVLNYYLDDSNFTYYEVFEGESGWLDTVSRNIWSTVTLNWSHKDEAQGLITNFLTEQAKLENVENLANEIEKEMGSNLAVQVIDFITDEIAGVVGGAGSIWDAIDSVDKFAHLKINMKKWVSAGNSAKYFGGSSWWSQFNAQVSKYNKWSKSWKWVSKAGKVMNYLPVISVALDEFGDIAEYAKAYSTLAATAESFVIFEDILETIANNDSMDEKFVAKGVQPILDSIKNSNNSFVDDFCRDLSVATAENIGSIAITLLSAHNPLLIAINIIVGLIDEFWLGDISEGAYALYVVKEMVDASKSLIDYTSGTWYSSFEDTEKIYLRLIWKARIEGGVQAKKIINKQIFWGEKDSEARARICGYIDGDNALLDAYTYNLSLR